MKFKSREIQNWGNLKDFGNGNYKVTNIKNYVQLWDKTEKSFTAKGEAGNDGKLQTNITRAKRRVEELGLCNPWEYFVTLTFDAARHDRGDLEHLQKEVSQFIRDTRKSKSLDIKYLLIPELHQDGQNWHMHGFMKGLPAEQLRALTDREHLPYTILEKINNGQTVYTWPAYQRRFGYCNFEQINNRDAATHYIMKYITKDLARTVTDINAHLYYASQGLKGAKLLAAGIITQELKPDTENDKTYFENEYIQVKKFTEREKALAYFDEADILEETQDNDNGGISDRVVAV